jgi:CTP:molybdopterin cytidylyltransferase MocA
VKIAGLLLAAGAGRRLGTPKALVRDPESVAWVVRTSRLLTSSGCSPVVVVVGAAAEAVRGELAGEPVQVVEATDWDEGMGASLRAGLTALRAGGPEGVVVVTVDVPGLTEGVVRRVVGAVGARGLVRATYGGVPGHPVGIGREHWDGVIASARGDVGARAYLTAHAVAEIECGDLGDGADVDTVEQLPPGHG